VDHNLAVVLVFGVTALAALSFSPIGRGIADGIRARLSRGGRDPALLEEMDRLRQEVAELQGRLDFAERLLARGSPASSPSEER